MMFPVSIWIKRVVSERIMPVRNVSRKHILESMLWRCYPKAEKVGHKWYMDTTYSS